MPSKRSRSAYLELENLDRRLDELKSKKERLRREAAEEDRKLREEYLNLLEKKLIRSLGCTTWSEVDLSELIKILDTLNPEVKERIRVKGRNPYIAVKEAKICRANIREETTSESEYNGIAV